MDAAQWRHSSTARGWRRATAALAVFVITCWGAGCGERPVSSESPNPTSVRLQDVRYGYIDRIDVLFVIDNSLSMADKQQTLSQAVPALLSHLILPKADPVTGKRPFDPIEDIHIGVISSSLGGHGGDQCSKWGPAAYPAQYDNAHLMGSGIRPQYKLVSYDSLGFLWWDPTGQKASPPGESSAAALIANFAAHVTAAGESGCGFEASLESWYRFLVDPAPPADVVVQDYVATVVGVDAVVLQQRKDFLRRDSLVAVIMLSDENDCSIVDGGVNWIATQTSNLNNTSFHLPRATAACATDPNSACCRSCASSEGAPPAGCGAILDDSECQKGLWDDVGDHPNLRCWNQERRFGQSFLYPTRRYVEALTQPRICPKWDASGPVACAMEDRVPNPLFNSSPTGVTFDRDPGLVYFAGIVGVPWQDIARDESLTGPGLSYLNAAELAAKGRWDWLVPRCLEPVSDPLPRQVPMCSRWDLTDEPDDALMVESSLPRTGSALAIKQLLADPNAGPFANPINGHEWKTADADLQYACIFPLATPRDCSVVSSGCDCDDVGSSYTANNPLCQDTTGYSKLQLHAKAFPGTRQLQVLKDIGFAGMVASICPKVTTGDTTDPSYGYNPAVETINDRLTPVLAGQCLSIAVELPKSPSGNIDPTLVGERCVVAEVTLNTDTACAPCDGTKNRSPVSPNMEQIVLERLKATGQCGNQVPCDLERWCMCELGVANDIDACLNELEPDETKVFGWCYIDATTDPPSGNPALVEGCMPARQLRFVGESTPASSATMFIGCQGPSPTSP